MQKFLFLIAAGLTFFTSCKLTTHIHFNADNSGSVTIIYDMTELLAGSDDSTGILDSMTESLQKMDTLSFLKNYKVIKTEMGIEVTYAFANIDELNNSFHRFMEGDDQMERTRGKFTAKRKKITYKLIEPAEKKTEEEDVMSSMNTDGLFDWKFTVSFEKKIKKCSNKNYAVDQTTNSITVSGGLNTFQNPEIMDFTVKLK